MTARRWPVLAALVIITAIAGFSARQIRFDNSIESWFLDTDPSLALYNTYTDAFNADQIVVLGVFADDVLSLEVLQAVGRISDGAAALPFVDRVQSITNSPLALRVGGIDTPDFRKGVLASPLQRAMLISPHADATAIIIYYSRDGDSFREKRRFVTALRGIADAATADVAADYALSGGPVVGEAGQARNNADLRLLVPVMILVIVGVAYGVIRRVSLTLLPLGVVAIAATWSYGLMSALGWRMTMISIILIPLILAVGVAHSIHVIARYRLNLQRGLTHDAAVLASVSRLLRPCFFTSITTVFGLLSLLVSDLRPVQEFAITAAAGVFAAFQNTPTSIKCVTYTGI